MGPWVHGVAWNLCRARHHLNGKLLLPQWTCHNLGKDGQRRISWWNYPGFLNGKEGSVSSLPTDIRSVLVTTSAKAITIPVTLYKMEDAKNCWNHCSNQQWGNYLLHQPLLLPKNEVATRETMPPALRSQHWWNSQLQRNDMTSSQTYPKDWQKKHSTKLLCVKLRKEGQHHPQIPLVGKKQPANQLGCWGGPHGWNGNSLPWWPTNSRTMLSPMVPQSDGKESIWICHLDLCPTKEHGDTPKGAGKGSPPHPKTHPVHCLGPSCRKVEQKHPLQYSKYTKVFDEPKDGKLPPWHPFDHTIDLKEIFIPKVAKSYLMNPMEMEACKEFIDEHLKSGKIQKSQSPQASPFFFIQKKDGGLRPCQDYWYLNEHTVKMHTCFRSSPPSLTNWRS